MQRGAKQRTENPMKFWSFSRGQFVRRVDENNKEAVSRVLEKGPNAGKTVYEIFMDEITGQLIDCKIKDGEFGKSFQLIIDVTIDEPEYFAIDFKFQSAGKRLLKVLPNIDLEKDVALKCWEMDTTNTKGDPITLSGTTVYQGEVSKNGKVPPAYTKEEPNGFPEMQKVKVKGKEQWDDSDQIDFLEDLINSTPWPGMPGEEAKEPNQPKTETKEEATHDEPFEEPTDEVVF